MSEAVVVAAVGSVAQTRVVMVEVLLCPLVHCQSVVVVAAAAAAVGDGGGNSDDVCVVVGAEVYIFPLARCTLQDLHSEAVCLSQQQERFP